MNKYSSEEQEIPEILKLYSLPEPLSIRRIPVGLSNNNYIVKTTKGKYAIKFINNYRKEILENDLSIQKHLRELDINCPRYIRNKKGDYVCSKGKSRVVVSRKIRGVRPNEVGEKLAYSIGRILAKFHVGIVGLPHNIQGWMDIHNTNSKTGRFLKKVDLPIGITHGDMYEGNIHVLKEDMNKVYAIFDFEEVGKDLLIVDLARSILAVCVREKGTKMDDRLIKAEIKGYQSIRLLEENEKRYFRKAFTHAVNKCIEWFLDNNCERYIKKHKLRLLSFRSPFE